MASSTGNGSYAVIVDTARRLPGRGAWLHPAPQCVQQAIRRRAFNRALRITGSPDTSAVVEHLSPAHRATEQVATNMSTP
ncbi:YlxR family protein [Mycobacterium asiaticum]|uniref:YlxR family protein n=1 Tax=Mycobacterium asiaticum TaxID=1790 RepID=UPI0036F3CD8E